LILRYTERKRLVDQLAIAVATTKEFRMKVKLCVALLALMVVMLPLSLLAGPGAAPANARLTATQVSANLPLSFEPADASGRYLARSGRYAVSIGATESFVVVTNPKSRSSQMLRFALQNANAAASIEAFDPLPGVTNYYVGNDPQKWRFGVKNFAKLQAKSIYPGVDMVYYGDQRRLEFDFVVAPNADPDPIALTFSGMDRLYTGAEGDLVAEVGGQPVRFAKPFAYQVVAGNKKPVSVEYALAGSKAQLRIGEYDKNLELVIDPIVTYATYLGGHQTDEVDGMAVDVNGNTYVTGKTCSPDFPGTSSTSTNCNAYVTEIKADGSALVGNTVIIGGNNNSWGRAIVLDSAGTAYVVGGTNSTDLPTNTTITKYDGTTKPNAWFGGDSDAFIAIISGGTLQRLAYLGGSGADDGFGVAVDGDKNVIATGETCFPTGLDTHPDFPAYSELQLAFQRKAEMCVGFITKLDNALNLYVQDPVNASWGDAPDFAAPAGGKFYFSEYFGGQPPNVPTGGWMANHSFHKGDVISVTYYDGATPKSNAEKCIGSGITGSVQPGWSSTQNAVDTDGTATWQNMGPPGALVNATTISRAVAVDPLGDIFVAGGSDSGFIGCALCGDTSYYIGSGAWVAKVSKDGGWVYSTVLGTIPTDTANAIAVDGSGRAYIAGTSTGGIFIPANTTSFQPKNGGGQDAFIVQLDNAGTNINYASYLGGSGNDQGNGVTVDVNGAAYIVGSTKSSNFPTVNPLTNTTTSLPMNALSGPEDAFVTRIIPGGSAVAFSSYIGGTNADQAFAVAAAQDGAFVVAAGSTHSFDFPVYQADPNAPPVFQPIYNKGVDNDAGDAFVVRIPIATLPNIAISPNNLDFGSVNVGTTTPVQPVTFTNTGNSPITITAVSVTGEFASDPASNCSNAILATNQSCTVQVTFTPTAGGVRPAGTIVFHDNGTGSPQTVNLSGTGISTSGGSINITPSSSPFTFADQPQNTTSTAKVFTITNVGNAAVTFTSITLTPVSGDFALTTDPSNPANACSTSSPLASGANCTIAVKFTPTGTGARPDGTLTVTASSNTVTMTLKGNGTAAPAADFTVVPPGTAVSVGVGKSGTFVVGFTPSGGFIQTITLTCTPPSPATCSVSPTSVSMDGTTSKTATVTVNVPAGSSGGSGGTRTGSIHWGVPFGALPFCAALTLFGKRRRRWVTLLLVAFGLVLVCTGCGGGGSSSGSSGMTPGSYSVTVTATYSGGTAHTVAVPVTVTP
jgi:hypothetical protein